MCRAALILPPTLALLLAACVPSLNPLYTSNQLKGHLIRAHTFGRITRNGDQMRVAMLDPDWLEPMITQKKISLEHVRIEDDIVLTAPTAALQEFIRKHVADPKAFTDPVELIRQKQ